MIFGPLTKIKLHSGWLIDLLKLSCPNLEPYEDLTNPKFQISNQKS